MLYPKLAGFKYLVVYRVARPKKVQGHREVRAFGKGCDSFSGPMSRQWEGYHPNVGRSRQELPKKNSVHLAPFPSSRDRALEKNRTPLCSFVHV